MSNTKKPTYVGGTDFQNEKEENKGSSCIMAHVPKPSNFKKAFIDGPVSKDEIVTSGNARIGATAAGRHASSCMGSDMIISRSTIYNWAGIGGGKGKQGSFLPYNKSDSGRITFTRDEVDEFVSNLK